MAELEAGRPVPFSARDIPARAQLLAVAWLRWRIFVNNTFRRRSSGKGHAIGLALAVLVRIIVWPFLALMVIGPIGGSGYLAWAMIAGNHPQRLAPLLAAITVLWLFVSVNGQNVAAALSSFDPSALWALPCSANIHRIADAEHHCGLFGIVGRRYWNRSCETCARAACAGS